MTHCQKHGLNDCPICPKGAVERTLEIQRRIEEKVKRRYRTKNPYLHFGEA